MCNVEVHVRVLLLLILSGQVAFGLQVPDGFKVERADDPAHSEFPMFAAFDDKGRLFVAESSGLDLYAEISALTRKCRVRVLEDRDNDGKFERSEVFADKLVFPMGLVWRDGKLYVADPPNLITIEDSDADGRGDKRTVILSEFGHKDNGSLHGLIFGPDGWLYMTTGSPDGYKFKRPDGSVLEGESGALIRCRPDGGDVEVLARGFENLVEVVFTPEWEIIGTLNWYRWPAGGVRDALVHLLPGGLYPMHKEVGTPQPITGDPLPALAVYPAVALSGLARYEGSAFPQDMRGNLFSAQHNPRKVQRHVLVREGSTYRAEDHEFLTTDDPDFHPSDVLEAPDGSLLVLDTGSWYTQHCPTGKIRNSQSRGGIYRVSYALADAPLAVNPARFLSRSVLARMRDFTTSELVRLLESGEPHEQLAAAECLARFGTSRSVPALFNGLHKTGDRMLEHAIIYAIHRHATESDLRRRLKDPEPRVQAAALLLLDQPPRLAADFVLDRALSTNAHIRKTAIMVLRRHPEWSSQLQTFLRNELTGPKANYEELAPMLLELQQDENVHTLIGNLLTEDRAKAPLLGVIARTTLPKVPPSWLTGIKQALQDRDPAIRLAAVRACNAVPELADAARPLADDPNQPEEIRRAALRTQPKLSTDAVDFLRQQFAHAANPLNRFAAGEILRAQKLLPINTESSSDAARTLRHWEPLLAKGSADRGRAIFFSPKTACATCHAVAGEGGTIGPDLTKVGAIRSGRDILESILFPSSTFAQGYQSFTIITMAGNDMQGIVARETTDGVLLRDASGTETPIRREQIREMKPANVSIMPTGLEQAITRQEFADLLAFLQSLK
jgi:putative heme-binding domain-containing protein